MISPFVKGIRTNTGLHDLRNGTILDIIPGRTIEELQGYFHTQPTLWALKPVAIVMDLAKAYHTFAKTMYPSAIRIADRYHVNRYVTEALQTVRKSVQKELPPRAKKELKKHFRLLGKRKNTPFYIFSFPTAHFYSRFMGGKKRL